MKQSLTIIVVLFATIISSLAQQKTDIKKIDIIDNSTDVVLPSLCKNMSKNDFHTSIFIKKGFTSPEIVNNIEDNTDFGLSNFVKGTRVDEKSSADYIFELQINTPSEDAIVISYEQLHPELQAGGWIAKFFVKANSTLVVKDRELNVVKTFILADTLQPMIYYCCMAQDNPVLKVKKELERAKTFNEVTGFPTKDECDFYFTRKFSPKGKTADNKPLYVNRKTTLSIQIDKLCVADLQSSAGNVIYTMFSDKGKKSATQGKKQ